MRPILLMFLESESLARGLGAGQISGLPEVTEAEVKGEGVVR